MIQNWGQKYKKHTSCRQFFKHKYITMDEVMKIDALVVAATQLAKVLKVEILANVGKQEDEVHTTCANIPQCCNKNKEPIC